MNDEEIKVSELDAVNEIKDTDQIMLVTGGANKKVLGNYINEHGVKIGSSEPDTNQRVWFKQGKNLFGNYGILYGVFINGTANKTDSNANATSVYIQIEPSTTYTISKTKGNRFAIGFAETLPNNNTSLTGIEDDRTATSLTSTSASNSHYLVIYISLSDSETFDNIVATIQVEKGSTATTYEAYITPGINVDNREIYNKPIDTDWKIITFDNNSYFSARSGGFGYTPKYRKIGNVVYLQGQFQVKSNLTALTNYNITNTNIPKPKFQHSFSISGYGANYGTAFINNNTITFRPYVNWNTDTIGIAIDGCYITDD